MDTDNQNANQKREQQSYVPVSPDDWSDADAPYRPRVDSEHARTYGAGNRVYKFAQHEAQTNQNPKGCASRTISIVLGLLIILIGIPMLICPGPGLLVITLGAGMVLAGLGLGKKEGTT